MGIGVEAGNSAHDDTPSNFIAVPSFDGAGATRLRCNPAARTSPTQWQWDRPHPLRRPRLRRGRRRRIDADDAQPRGRPGGAGARPLAGRAARLMPMMPALQRDSSAATAMAGLKTWATRSAAGPRRRRRRRRRRRVRRRRAAADAGDSAAAGHAGRRAGTTGRRRRRRSSQRTASPRTARSCGAAVVHVHRLPEGARPPRPPRPRGRARPRAPGAPTPRRLATLPTTTTPHFRSSSAR